MPHVNANTQPLTLYAEAPPTANQTAVEATTESGSMMATPTDEVSPTELPDAVNIPVPETPAPNETKQNQAQENTQQLPTVPSMPLPHITYSTPPEASTTPQRPASGTRKSARVEERQRSKTPPPTTTTPTAKPKAKNTAKARSVTPTPRSRITTEEAESSYSEPTKQVRSTTPTGKTKRGPGRPRKDKTPPPTPKEQGTLLQHFAKHQPLPPCKLEPNQVTQSKPRHQNRLLQLCY